MCEVRSASTHLSLSPHVARLVDYIWSEAVDQLETVLAVSVATVTQEQLDKAEAALLSIRRELDGDKSSEFRLPEIFSDILELTMCRHCVKSRRLLSLSYFSD